LFESVGRRYPREVPDTAQDVVAFAFIAVLNWLSLRDADSACDALVRVAFPGTPIFRRILLP
jgi:hypothetical protein